MQTMTRFFSALSATFLLGFCLAVGSGQAHADDTMEIYLWVAAEMEIDFIPPMPQIHFVDKDQLQAAFRKGNHNSYLRWQVEYGEAQAQRIMSRYLKGIVGLFLPESETVYVYGFLPPCRRRAVLSHELCHFFQHITHGVIRPDAYGADAIQLVREMEAYKIEKKYMDTHCVPAVP